MKINNHLFLSILFLFITYTSYSQVYDWSTSFGSTGEDVSHASTIDSSGNIYLSGTFTGTVDFDGTGTYTATSAGNEDIFIIKYDTAGSILWLKTYGGTETDKGAGIITDNTGNVYLTGDFKSEHVDFGGAGATDVSTKGEEDIFLLKLDTNGNFLWFHTYGAAAKDAGISLDFDTQGDLLLTGFFALTGRFNLDDPTQTITSAGQIDVFVLKLGTSGNFIWVKGFGGPNLDKGLFLKTDYNDNIYVTGYFYDTIDCNPGTGATEVAAHTSNGERDFYIVKLNSTGDHLWSGSIGSVSDDRALSIAIDDTNNTYFSGFFADTVDFDISGGTHNLSSNGNDDAFLFKMDENGVLNWAKQFGGSEFDLSTEVIIDNDGNLLLAGSYAGTVDFDTSAATQNATSKGQKDIFVLKLTDNGDYLWNISIGNAGIDEAFSINVDATNNISVAGSFSSNVDFNFGAGTDFQSSIGGRDVFVTRINDNTASVTDTVFNSSLKISPNPVDSFFKITTSHSLIKTEIYTISGAFISKYKNTKHISMQFVPTGIYFAKMYDENGSISTRKIIKR